MNSKAVCLELMFLSGSKYFLFPINEA